MDDLARRIANLSPEKRVLLEIQLQKKKGLREPIAIIGLGCRFPGAKNPQAFWQLLQDGVDAITEVPRDRWDVDRLYDSDPTAPGKMYCRWGGFLDQVDQFDPEFFGIAPREAAYIDPQQRLLLEVIWEALEDAGQIPAQLSGTKTGMFVGLSTNDYGQRLLRGPEVVDTYSTTGVAVTMAANRISYLLNLRGPSLAVDTACSASLAAVHLACQSLWTGESTLALAGGVNLILTPSLTVGFSKLTALSPDGRCKAFDARANGFVRSEGAGIVVLKPLSQAIRDRDPIYAVIRGSAINQDGRTNGLTAPSREAQEAVLLEAYRRAGVPLEQLQYVEAHGTGTLLGDPIEAQALGNVLQQHRPADMKDVRVRIGSVKTNIGHLEAAAGIASLIKIALCLKYRQWVPTIHFQEPNPHIPFDQLPLQVQQTCEPWTAGPGPATAGISSFGFGGSNAHVVLQAAPTLSPAVSCRKGDFSFEDATRTRIAPPDLTGSGPDRRDRTVHLLTLSAKSESALRELAQRYATFLTAHPEISLANVCFTANTARSHFPHRLAIPATSTVDLAARLGAFASGQAEAGGAYGLTAPSRRPKIVFLFTGQGSQYVEMGRQLYETQPVFRDALDRCDQILRPYLKRSLLSVLYPEGAFRETPLLHETVYTQPALFALEYALAVLWQSWGVVPDAVMGHSVGEYVAACVAGVFSLEEGLKLIAERGRLMQGLPRNGAMAAVFADVQCVQTAIASQAEKVTIAAVNGPENTVISGEREAVQSVLEQLAAQGIAARSLQVSHAFHSPLMDPILDAFEPITRSVNYQAPRIPLVSNLTGQTLQTGEIPGALYWRNHLRQAVQFAPSMQTLAQAGYEVFLELGPSPVLLGMGRRCLPEHSGVWLPSLRQGQEDWAQLFNSLATLYVQGVPVDWQGFDQPYARQCLAGLPTYAFQRSRYWVDIPDLPGQVAPLSEAESAAVSEPSEDFADWLYQLSWRPKTRPDQALGLQAADYIPAPRQLAETLQVQVTALSQQYDLARYEPLGPQLDRLSAAYILQAFQQLGWQPDLGQSVSVQGLAETLGVVEPHYRLLERLIRILAEEDVLQSRETDWQVSQIPDAVNPENLRQGLLQEYPDCATELTLLGRCGQALAKVLKGEQDPLQLLFPDDDPITAEQLYQDSPVAQVFNTLVQDAIATAIQQLPAHRTVRILEIGAGTGGTTAHILPKLPRDRTDYVFSDISSLFTAKAVQKFRDYPFIQYQRLDIEQDPAAQGYASHQFDLILAANVLHATQDLRQTLQHVQQLLAPQGLLVLLEGAGPQRWMDLIFGLTEGWWRFRDTVRSNHPLLFKPQWIETLESLGFTEAAAAPIAAETSRALSQQAIILAQGPQIAKLEQPRSLVPSERPKSWLILTDQTGVGAALARHLQARGDRPVLVFAGDTYATLGPKHYQVNPAQPPDFQRLLQDVQQTSDQPLQGILHLWSLDIARSQPKAAHDLEAASVLGCRSALHLLQALVQAEQAQPPRLWLVTQGAQSVPAATALLNVAQSPLWGLGRVASREHPEVWGGLIDLDSGDVETAAIALLSQIDGPDEENQIVFRGRQRYVARLTRPSDLPVSPEPLSFRADASYLITGGLGGLGLKVARWMAERGARHLVLLGRSQPSAAARETLAIIEQMGTQVLVQSVDVTQLEPLTKLFKEMQRSLPPLRGVMHAAGVLEDGILLQQDWPQFQKVLAPKLSGTWNLHTLTQDQSLDFFVLFSSVAALLGPPAQANHAAANSFLDVFAHYRRQQGLPALSINWGIWSEIGAAAERKADQRMMLQGVGNIAWQQGLQVLEQLMQQPHPQIGVLPMDWSAFVAQLPAGEEPLFLAEVASDLWQQRRTQANQQPDAEVLQQLLALSADQRQDFLTTYLQRQVAKALGTRSEIPTDRNVMDLGMDSLMVVEVLNACKRDLQLTLYPREFYERPAIAPLAQYLAQEVSRAHESTSTVTAAPPSSADREIQTWTWSSTQQQRQYTKPTYRNPGIIFLLSSPRSGSTLLRVMLAGHASLFSPPELHLLPFETMSEWQQELSLSYLGEGLQRALMELMDLDADASKTLVEEWVQQDWPIQDVYAKLQDLIASRILVDKSPTYAGNLQTLQRAEDLFEHSKYIHLVRHPYSVIHSLVRNRMDKILGITDVDPYFLAEQVWLQSNRNVLEFRQQVGPERHYLIRYEDLVSQPAQEMRRLCEFLDIPFDPALLQPYEGDRMTDGVRAGSMAINDPNFLQHDRIDASLAQAWRQIQLPRPLSDAAQQIAAELRYELPTQTPVSAPPVVTPEVAEPSPRQEFTLDVNGLRLHLCSWGPEEGSLILCLHGVLEHGAAWEAVAQPLAHLGYRVIAPDQRGHGWSDHAASGNGYQLLDYLGDVDAIARALTAEPFTLVGHSMGSAVAATFASVRSGQVSSLVLVEPVLPSENPDHEAVAQLTNHLDYLAAPPQHPRFADVQEAADRLRRHTPSMSEAQALKVAQRLTEPCEGGVRWRWDPRLQIRTGLGFSGTAFTRSRYLQLLRQIQAPITLVYGDASNFNKPEDRADQQAAMPYAKQVTLPGEHNLPIDAPAGLAQVIAEAAARPVSQPSRS